MILDEQSGGDDLDSLIASVDAPAPERPQSEPQAAEPSAPPAPTEWEFEWSGSKIKAPQDTILKKYAPMGYDYAQKMEAFNKEKASLAEKYKPYERFKEVDDYIKKDPAWWDHVNESWNKRLESEDPTIQRVKAILDEKLAPVQNLLSQKEQEEQQRKTAEEDTHLAEEIKSIREKYSDLDFDTPDADGQSLEMKVLKYANENKIPNFRMAFRDYYHDQLEARWEARGREAIGKESAKRTKLGLPAPGQAPKKAQTPAYDTRGKSWNQVLQDVFEQENIT
jgi:hypothetical protein